MASKATEQFHAGTAESGYTMLACGRKATSRYEIAIPSIALEPDSDWCAPCRAEAIQQLREIYGSNAVDKALEGSA